MKKEKYNVAVVGATGAVGEQMREILDERLFPVDELRLLASERSAGQHLEFQQKQVRVGVLDEHSFEDIDIALFSAGGEQRDVDIFEGMLVQNTDTDLFLLKLKVLTGGALRREQP